MIHVVEMEIIKREQNGELGDAYERISQYVKADEDVLVRKQDVIISHLKTVTKVTAVAHRPFEIYIDTDAENRKGIFELPTTIVKSERSLRLSLLAMRNAILRMIMPLELAKS